MSLSLADAVPIFKGQVSCLQFLLNLLSPTVHQKILIYLEGKHAKCCKWVNLLQWKFIVLYVHILFRLKIFKGKNTLSQNILLLGSSIIPELGQKSLHLFLLEALHLKFCGAVVLRHSDEETGEYSCFSLAKRLWPTYASISLQKYAHHRHLRKYINFLLERNVSKVQNAQK